MAITSLFFAALGSSHSGCFRGHFEFVVRISHVGCRELRAAREHRRHILLNIRQIIYKATWLRSGSRASRRR